MTSGALADSAAPMLEVRIYRNSQLLGREQCESEEAVTTVVDRWSGVANLFVVADGPPTVADEPPAGPEGDGIPLASRSLPGLGTE